MTRAELTAAFKRISAGERATLVVRAENEVEARALLSKLSPRLQSLLTIQVR